MVCRDTETKASSAETSRIMLSGTSSYETHPGFISREQHHQKHTRSRASTQWALWIDMLHQSQSMSTQNAGAEGRRGGRAKERQRIITLPRLRKWLGGSKRNKADTEKAKEKRDGKVRGER